MRYTVAIYKKLILVLLMSIYGCSNTQNNTKKVANIDYGTLEAQKSLINNGDKKAVSNYKKLIKKADSLLNVKGFSVVNKTGLPPSKNGSSTICGD